MVDLVIYKGEKNVYIIAYEDPTNFYLTSKVGTFIANFQPENNLRTVIDLINDNYSIFKLEYYKIFKITEEKARYLIDIKDRILLDIQIEYINEGNIY